MASRSLPERLDRSRSRSVTDVSAEEFFTRTRRPYPGLEPLSIEPKAPALDLPELAARRFERTEPRDDLAFADGTRWAALVGLVVWAAVLAAFLWIRHHR